MMGCAKCRKVCGWGLLVLGVLFLLRDFGVWAFWNVQWWSALLVWFGIGSIAMTKCPDCMAACAPMGKKK